MSTSIVNNILCPSEIWGGKTAAEHLMNVFHFPRELQFPLLSLLKSCGNSIISSLCAECICDNYAASDDWSWWPCPMSLMLSLVSLLEFSPLASLKSLHRCCCTLGFIVTLPRRQIIANYETPPSLSVINCWNCSNKGNNLATCHCPEIERLWCLNSWFKNRQPVWYLSSLHWEFDALNLF